MRCKNCHYSLEGLTEHRCPGCGTPFDPDGPATVFDAQRWRTVRTVCLVAVFVIILLIAYQLLIVAVTVKD